jgi:hypothetical protein
MIPLPPTAPAKQKRPIVILNYKVKPEEASPTGRPDELVKKSPKQLTGTMEKSWPKFLCYFCHFQNTAQSKVYVQSTNRRKFAQSGVDVMITIFCDF